MTSLDFHFYRCHSCKAILTKVEEDKARLTGKICECGSAKYNPTNPTDSEWDLPKVKAYCEANDLQKPEPENV